MSSIEFINVGIDQLRAAGIDNMSEIRVAVVSADPPISGWFGIFNFVAYVDNWGADASPHGRGATEEIAVSDLLSALFERE